MSDAELRRLERGWNAGEAEAGVRLVLERLRRGLPLPAPDREAWDAMWDHVKLEADPGWRSAALVTGWSGGGMGSWGWLARLADGRWLHVRAWHECWSGWDCLAKGRVVVTDTGLEGLGLLLDSDDVLGLLGAPRGGGDDVLRSLELAWGVGDRSAGARLVVERLRRRRPLSPPDRDGWEDMFEFDRIEAPAPSWRSAGLVAGCSPAEHETTWLARLGHGRWLHVRRRHHCPICTGGWSCVGEARGRVTTLAKLGELLDADEVRGLLATS